MPSPAHSLQATADSLTSAGILTSPEPVLPLPVAAVTSADCYERYDAKRSRYEAAVEERHEDLGQVHVERIAATARGVPTLFATNTPQISH